MNESVSICWLRRDLRLDDNAALYHALRENENVIPLFIFDTVILDQLEDKSDKRVQFIHEQLIELQSQLKGMGANLLVKVGKPMEVWTELLNELKIRSVYTNHDFEPYAIDRDGQVETLLGENSISFNTYKDHVIFEKDEVTKDDGQPYMVFTPYSRKWMSKLKPFYYKSYPCTMYYDSLCKTATYNSMPTLEALGFQRAAYTFPDKVVQADIVKHYSEQRDFPGINGTSRLGLHLRFGTLSIRKLLSYAIDKNQAFVSELVWRDFYQQILWHYPHVTRQAFKKEYDLIEWINDESMYKKWCDGVTGYPLVDAGMRELNETGFMHNRVRMVTASFLTKHLLIDWRWGEAYFAQKLLDFDLAANNGGWQWAAGCGTDAAPYFRVFSPAAQMEKFDPQQSYVKRWVPEYGTDKYPAPIINHEMARKRCLEVYQKAVKPK